MRSGLFNPYLYRPEDVTEDTRAVFIVGINYNDKGTTLLVCDYDDDTWSTLARKEELTPINYVGEQSDWYN